MSKTVQKNYTQVPNQIIQHSRLDPNEKLVLIYILSFKRCFASLNHMGSKLGLSRSTVQRAIARLVTDKLIEKTHKGGFVFEYSVNLKSLKNFRPKNTAPKIVSGVTERRY